MNPSRICSTREARIFQTTPPSYPFRIMEQSYQAKVLASRRCKGAFKLPQMQKNCFKNGYKISDTIINKKKLLMLARTVIYNYHSCNRNIFLTTQYAYMEQFGSYLSCNNNNSPNIPRECNIMQKTRENIVFHSSP